LYAHFRISPEVGHQRSLIAEDEGVADENELAGVGFIGRVLHTSPERFNFKISYSMTF